MSYQDRANQNGNPLIRFPRDRAEAARIWSDSDIEKRFLSPSIDLICGYLVKRARALGKIATPNRSGGVTATDMPEGHRKRKRKIATGSQIGKKNAPQALLEIPPPEETPGPLGFPSCWHSN
ncbi:hypothetical protein Q3G72_015240 [Acer saccharum]|nr:hypothetical protein Q3G72_015240 [Acer saccharum]